MKRSTVSLVKLEAIAVSTSSCENYGAAECHLARSDKGLTFTSSSLFVCFEFGEVAEELSTTFPEFY